MNDKPEPSQIVLPQSKGPLTTDEITKIADCANCPFAKEGKPPHRPVLAEIPSDTPIGMLVGEGPGESEIEKQRPFSGMTGEGLDLLLAREGIPRSRLVVANAMACKPPPSKNDAMLRAASKSCHALFKHQTDPYVSLPKLTMGKWATWAVLGRAIKTEQTRGFIRDNNTITTWHPTYAFFRNPWVKGDFEVDIARFKRLLDGKLQADPRVVINPTTSDVEELLREIANNNHTVAVDIETSPEKGSHPNTGKDPTRCTLKTIALGTNEYAIALRWPHQPDVWIQVHNILMDPSVKKVFHNGWFFDLRVLSRYGIEVRNIVDTREIRRALVATSGLSLRYLAQTYVDFPPWKEMEDEK